MSGRDVLLIALTALVTAFLVILLWLGSGSSWIGYLAGLLLFVAGVGMFAYGARIPPSR